MLRGKESAYRELERAGERLERLIDTSSGERGRERGLSGGGGVDVTDAGVDGEEEKEEGDEEVDGVHGERHGGRRGVEGALNAEVGEGRFVVVVHLRVNRAASSDAKESGTVQLGDRHQCRREWREEGSVDDRFQHEHGSEDAEREVRRHGQQQRHGDANDVVDHAVDALQRGEVGGLERIGLDAPERQLHDFADVELGVKLRVIRVSHRYERVAVCRTQQHELDVLVASEARAQSVSEQREEPLRRRGAVGEAHGAEEGVNLQTEDVQQSQEPPGSVGEQHAALVQRLQHHVDLPRVCRALDVLRLEVVHDERARDQTVGGTSEQQVHDDQEEDGEGENGGGEEDPEQEDHVIETVEDRSR